MSLLSTINEQKSTLLIAPDESDLRMSTREIAELCSKRHNHVKRDFRKVCDDLEIDVTKFGVSYLDVQNRQQIEYVLDKDLTFTLVSGYNAKTRFRIIRRWFELEEQVKKPATHDLSRKD